MTAAEALGLLKNRVRLTHYLPKEGVIALEKACAPKVVVKVPAK